MQIPAALGQLWDVEDGEGDATGGFLDRHRLVESEVRPADLHAWRRLEDERLPRKLLVEDELLELARPELLPFEQRGGPEHDPALALDEQAVLVRADGELRAKDEGIVAAGRT